MSLESKPDKVFILVKRQIQFFLYTLTHCVKTKNIQIFDDMYHHGSLPDIYNSNQNTLLHQIQTGDPMIVKKIILFGGNKDKRSYFFNGYTSLDLIIKGLFERRQWMDLNINDVYEIIYLYFL